MSKYLEKFIYHLKDDRNIPAHFLIQEIYRNNKKMLLAPGGVNILIADLVEKISKTPESYHKSYLLEMLKVFMFFKSKVIANNQTVIIDQLSSRKYTNILFLSSNSEHKQMIINDMELYDKDLADYERLKEEK